MGVFKLFRKIGNTAKDVAGIVAEVTPMAAAAEAVIKLAKGKRKRKEK